MSRGKSWKIIELNGGVPFLCLITGGIWRVYEHMWKLSKISAASRLLWTAHEPPEQDHYDMENNRVGAGAYGHVFTVTQRCQ